MNKPSTKNGHKKIRILSFHHIPNNGAFLFAYSLENILREVFQKNNIAIIDYKEPRLAIHESLKRLNFLPKTPFFYYKRAKLWQTEITKHLSLDKNLPLIRSQHSLQEYFSKEYDKIVVGMDVWCLTQKDGRPKFPNIFWLSQKMQLTKIAYGISAYNSEKKLIESAKSQLTTYLNDFHIIGARDRFTLELIQEYRQNKQGTVIEIPDPTFYYPIKNTNVKEKLLQLGILPNKPTLAILLHGQDELTQKICAHYRSRGYQIIALSMHSLFADINLGHLLTPFEWAEIFKHTDFCITDRFHGTVFCLKNKTPFLSVEKDTHLPRSQSKLYDLLTKFNMEACYQNPADTNFTLESFLAHATKVQAAWQKDFFPKIQPKLDTFKKELKSFNKLLNNTLG